MSDQPDIEKALIHLSAAGVEASKGMAVTSWAADEPPNPDWWNYRNAVRHIEGAERELKKVMTHP